MGKGEQQGALAVEGVGEVGRELERAIDRALERAEPEQAREARAGDPRPLAESAEAREVPERVVRFGGDRGFGLR